MRIHSCHLRTALRVLKIWCTNSISCQSCCLFDYSKGCFSVSFFSYIFSIFLLYFFILSLFYALFISNIPSTGCLVGAIKDSWMSGRWSIPSSANWFPRIDDSCCGRVHSSLTANNSLFGQWLSEEAASGLKRIFCGVLAKENLWKHR